MTIDDLWAELGYFAPGVARLNPPAAERDLALAESELGITFTRSLRTVLATFNGGFMVSEPVLGVPPVQSALDMVFATRQARTYWGALGWLPSFVEVGNDGAGNPYVLLLDRTDPHGESPVGIFDAGGMEVTEIVASTYLHYVWFLIQDVKWRHLPDGKPQPRAEVVWTSKKVVVQPDAFSPWRYNEAWMLAHDPGLARWR
ncbi:MAG: SMI1/KNR4 family protein [Armatimonadetes bacterium]|nr:SMI1/KNR4 family protein [Armatimonadota bacterium]